MKIAGRTNIGNRRNENQDKYIAGRLLNSVGFAFVCDGMGGVNGGEIASDMLVKYIEDALFLHNTEADFNVEKTIISAVEDANRAIYTIANKRQEYKGMGTTIAGVTIENNKCTIYHAGDSRVYIMRNGKLALVTKDHSIVQELLEQNKISFQEAQCHPQKNLITRAVGVEIDVDVDVSEVELCKEDIILCATDGLTNFVSPQEIIEILSTDNVFAMPDKLLSKALQNYATDNITVVVVSV